MDVMHYRVDAWCPLCKGRIRARDDEARKVCPLCGALLDVLPQPSGTPARHMGEAMDEVRFSLQPAALERALTTLRERYEARCIALDETLRMARIRRVWLIVAATLCLGGLLAMVYPALGGPGAGGIGRLGLALFFMGGLAMLGRLGAGAWHAGYPGSEEDYERRADERYAERTQRALRDEIARRERVLAALRQGSDF